MRVFCLGVDIGNVIIDHKAVGTNNKIEYEIDYSNIPAVKNAFEVLRELNKIKFGLNIHLISKCTPWAQTKILNWLKHNKFFIKTGIKPQNVHFCRERNEKQKICADFGITHFIDDRLEVLSYLIGKVPNLYLFRPDQKEIAQFKSYLSNVCVVSNWLDILTKIN